MCLFILDLSEESEVSKDRFVYFVAFVIFLFKSGDTRIKTCASFRASFYD